MPNDRQSRSDDCRTVSDAPPRLIGGEQTKNLSTQTGEQAKQPSISIKAIKGSHMNQTITAAHFQNEEYFSHVITVDGKLLEVPLRRGREDGAFIDALTFTVHKQSIEYIKGLCFSDIEYIAAYSEILIDIFGFGVAEQRKGKGRYFYGSYYRLGSDTTEYGTVHIGGQNDTVLVELTGTGCQAALPGWQLRLHTFLSQAKRPVITRIDCAHDFFNGEFTPEQALIAHDNGGFDRANRRPKSELRGTAWRLEDYTGKTFYVGRRGSSKMARIYEKGRQLGDKDSLWVRFEVEFRNKDCIIPLDILLRSGQYLGGAYPIGETLFGDAVKPIAAAQQKIVCTFESKLEHARNQVGRFLRFLKDCRGWDSDKIIDALIAEEGKYPKGLMLEEYDCRLVSTHTEYMTQDDLETVIEPIEHIVQIEDAVRIFDENSNGDLTELEAQLIHEFPTDLKRFMELHKQQRYYRFSERDFEQFQREQREIERAQNEYIDYMYIKYGTLLPKFSKQHPNHFIH